MNGYELTNEALDFAASEPRNLGTGDLPLSDPMMGEGDWIKGGCPPYPTLVSIDGYVWIKGLDEIEQANGVRF